MLYTGAYLLSKLPPTKERTMSITQEMNDLADFFTGADGGAGFAVVRAKLLALERQAAGGDKKAAEILVVAHRFHQLVNILQK